MTALTKDTGVEGLSLEGRTLGGFRLSREIACGGMATVYLAHKAGPGGVGQAAAIKVIHPHLSRDRDFVDMFLDEARIVACVNHPGVCRVLDFGKGEGTYYLAMEYVLGETWADVLSALKATPDGLGQLPGVVAQVLAQACEGLHAAHEAVDSEGRALNIVHRDVSPQNILVGYDGTVRVLDFGIASAAERLHTTRNGAIKGRFAYMSPEQMRGVAVDRRADLWSLGVLLWEGLTQERLFKRETEAETVLAVTTDPLPDLKRPGIAIPRALGKVAGRALSRDREQRYPTARELGLELSRFATSSLVPMGPAELSLWMQRLFAEKIALKRRLLRESARASLDAHSGSVAAAPPVLFDLSSPMATSSSTLPSISTVRELPRQLTRPAGRGKLIAGALIAATVASSLALLRVGEEHARPVSPPAPPLAAVPPAAVPDLPAPHAEPDRETPPRPAEVVPSPGRPPLAREQDEKPGRQAARAKTEAAVNKSAGTLDVVTPGGWAEVFEGQRKLGTTPARLTLSSGPHTLRLRPFGQAPELVRRVEIKPGAATKLKISLD